MFLRILEALLSLKGAPTQQGDIAIINIWKNSPLWFVLGFKAAAAAANVSRHDSKGGGKYPKGVATVGGGTVLLAINEGIKSEACLCLILDLDSLL